MKDKHFQIYYYSHTRPGVILRFLFFLSSLVFFSAALVGQGNLKVGSAVFAYTLINEIFLTELSRKKPKTRVQDNPKVLEDSLVFPALGSFKSRDNSYEIIEQIIKRNEVKFFMNRMGIEKIERVDIDKKELLKQAFEAVSWIKGDYITNVDFFASYILLSEDKSRLLQGKELNNNDVLNILYWTREKFRLDKFDSRPAKFLGTGVFDELVYEWNFEVKKYSKSLTQEVFSSFFPPVISGRENELDQLLTALSKHKSSNAIIVGESGVGKSSLVNYFAYASFLGILPKNLSKRQVFELLVDKLLSGVSTAGELEARLSGLLAEIAHSENAIVYIQNIEDIFGGGGFNFDATGALYDYLKSEKIKIIGTTTPSSFATFIENREGMQNLFEKVILEETNEGKTLLLLTQKTYEIERKYSVTIRYSCLKQCVVLSSIYFPDRFLPGRAVDLLENVASRANIKKIKVIDGEDVVKLTEEKTHVALATPGEKEKELLINLEEKIHKRVVGQKEAVRAVSDALRRLRSGFEEKARPISVFLFLGPTGVGKTETAKALALEYFGSQDSMIRLDMSEYQTQNQLERILGQSPGGEYVPNSLTDLVTKQPFSLILLDEFEKADPHILDIFLQVFDEGRLTDNRGKTVSFKNAIIIATSNAGSEILREKGKVEDPNVLKQELLDSLLRKNIFKPELINRFDDVILFRYLNQSELKEIAKILLLESFTKLEDNQIKVQFEDSVLEKISKEAYSLQFGARNIRRYIEENVEGFLSKQILENKIKKGDNVVLSVDSSNNIIVR